MKLLGAESRVVAVSETISEILSLNQQDQRGAQGTK